MTTRCTAAFGVFFVVFFLGDGCIQTEIEHQEMVTYDHTLYNDLLCVLCDFFGDGCIHPLPTRQMWSIQRWSHMMTHSTTTFCVFFEIFFPEVCRQR